MRRTVVILSACALALAGSVGLGAQIEWAGDPVIQLDANDLTPGATGTAIAWANRAAPGGTFTSEAAQIVQPTVKQSTPGQAGVVKNYVEFVRGDAGGYADNASFLRWSSAAPASITQGHSFSVEGWVYLATAAELQTYFSIGRRGATTPPTTVNNFACSAGWNPGMRAVGMAPASLLWVRTTHATGSYNYFAATYDSGSMTASVYLNGELDNSLVLGSPLDIAADQPVYLGAMWFEANGKFLQQGLHQGGIAALRVHDGVLTDAQVLNNFDAEKTQYLVLVPTFDESAPLTWKCEVNRPYTMAPPALLAPRVVLPATEVTWSFTGGVPADVTIDPTTGQVQIPGTLAEGSYPMTVTATNSYGADSVTVTLKIEPPYVVPPLAWAGDQIVSIDPNGLADGPIDQLENKVGALGTFSVVNTDPATYPEIRTVTVGTLGVARQVVHFNANNMMVWDNLTPPGITAQSDWSMEAWVAREAAVNGENVYFAWGSREGDVAQFCNNDGQSWVGWGGVADQGWNGTRPPDNEFAHVVFTYGGAAADRTMRMYVNAGLRAEIVGDNNIPAGEPVTLGGINSADWTSPAPCGGANPACNVTSAYIGSVAKIRVHDGVLPQSDIIENYLAERDLYRSTPEVTSMNVVAPTNPIVKFTQPFDAGPSGATTITLRNTSTGAITIAGIAIGGADAADFGHDGTDLTPLVPGVDRTFTVWADPVANNNPKQAELVITTSASSVTAFGATVQTGEVRFTLFANWSSLYVDAAAGNDANLGSEAAPLQTLRAALDRAATGGTIVLRPGTYTVGSEYAWSRQSVAVNAPEGATISQTFGSFGVTGGECTLAFDNITFTGGGGLGFWNNNNTAPVSWTFTRCTFDLPAQAWHGICCRWNTATTTMLFEDCTVGMAAGEWGCLYVCSDIDITIRRSTFIGRALADGTMPMRTVIQTNWWETSGTITLEDSTFIGSGYRGEDDGELRPAIVSLGGPNLSVRIDRCRFVRPELASVQKPLALELFHSGETLVTNCIFEGTDSGIRVKTSDPAATMGATKVYNCTVIGLDLDVPTSLGIEVMDAAQISPVVDVTNTILRGWATPIQGTTIGSNNMVDPAVDPLFVAPPSWNDAAGTPDDPFDDLYVQGDYHVLPGSPVLGAGTALAEVTVDFDKLVRPTPPSIGAFDLEQVVNDIFVLMGDANNSKAVDIADAIALLGYLFAQKAPPPCAKAADANDDDALNIADAISILGYLFSSKPMLAPDHSSVLAGNNTCTGYDAQFIPEKIGALAGCATQCAH